MKHAIIILLIGILSLTSCTITNNELDNIKNDSDNTKFTDDEPKICFSEKCFEVELATTHEERKTGLMNRETLPSNKGMLFIFDETKKHTFWMKNTTIPLDIIWLDEKMQVIHIQQAEPCNKIPCKTYKPNTNALYVLEINKGLAEKNNIQEQSQAQLIS